MSSVDVMHVGKVLPEGYVARVVGRWMSVPYIMFAHGEDITNNIRLALHRSYGPTDTDTFLPPGNDTGALVWEAQNVRATIENNSLFTQGIYAEMRYFCDCILEERAAERGSLEFALEVMKVYEAGLLSNGQTVSIS